MTHVTDLNVFETFAPKLSPAAQDCDVLFLANIQPDLQLGVREQCGRARFVAMDSMNFWIDSARDVARAHDPLRRLPDPQRRGARAADRQADDAWRPPRSC